MNKEIQILKLEEIIETAYMLLTNKLALGNTIAKNESALRLEFGSILKSIGHLYEFKSTDKLQLEFERAIALNEKSLKSNRDKARVDLLLKFQDEKHTTTAAIELKYFKKENNREPNNRYDVFRDLFNLELYKKNGVDLCYFILATDHAHYYNKENYSPDTADFDFRNGKNYQAGTVLNYKTAKPYGPSIALSQDYVFSWDEMEDLYFLKVGV